MGGIRLLCQFETEASLQEGSEGGTCYPSLQFGSQFLKAITWMCNVTSAHSIHVKIQAVEIHEALYYGVSYDSQVVHVLQGNVLYNRILFNWLFPIYHYNDDRRSKKGHQWNPRMYAWLPCSKTLATPLAGESEMRPGRKISL